jgi:L-serine/L-threonine ammonia-lyase
MAANTIDLLNDPIETCRLVSHRTIHIARLFFNLTCSKIYLKLESLQPSGSFKSRGVGQYLLSRLAKASSSDKIHFYISSGGNAGLACSCAAVSLGAPVTIVVPMSTTPYMISKIKDSGAKDVVQIGESWAEADAHLREILIPEAKARGEAPIYVPPFDAQEIWDGNATLVEEVLEQLPGPPDALVCSIGGGGLLSGIMQGLDAAKYPDTRVLAVETEGAHSLALSLEKGELATLPGITSIATSLGARRVAAKAYEYAQRNSVTSVVLKDDDAIEGCIRFADDERIMVEAACGVSLALCYSGRLKERLPGLSAKSKVVIVVCGGSNVSTEMLHKWVEKRGCY